MSNEPRTAAGRALWEDRRQRLLGLFPDKSRIPAEHWPAIDKHLTEWIEQDAEKIAAIETEAADAALIAERDKVERLLAGGIAKFEQFATEAGELWARRAWTLAAKRLRALADAIGDTP